jgi:pseudaminic acid cytidylyltransferase
MKAIALIPARGGSKRVPRKNILDFAGKPMIAWSIQAALSSGAFDEVIVSTDDSEIAQIAKQYGASVPFIRPAEISNDQAGLTAVIRHAITWLRDQGQGPDIVACAYATAPFLRAEDLRKSVEQLIAQPNAEYVLAVTSFAAPVQRAIAQGAEGYLEFLCPEFAEARSQNTREAFHDAGHFFTGRANAFMTYPSALFGKTLPCVIPRILCQDIDTPEDWNHALSLFEYWQFKKGGCHH